MRRAGRLAANLEAASRRSEPMRMLLSAITSSLLLLPMAEGNWNEQTVITFHAPVEIPGKILEPGTYLFKGFNGNTDREVIQIFTPDGKDPVATVETLAVFQKAARTNSYVTFELRAPKAPQAIREIYFPNDHYGHQFIYNR
jgi:hypothetical protein